MRCSWACTAPIECMSRDHFSLVVSGRAQQCFMIFKRCLQSLTSSKRSRDIRWLCMQPLPESVFSKHNSELLYSTHTSRPSSHGLTRTRNLPQLRSSSFTPHPRTYFPNFCNHLLNTSVTSNPLPHLIPTQA